MIKLNNKRATFYTESSPFTLKFSLLVKGIGLNKSSKFGIIDSC
jgi:hypothetical protein